MEVKTQELFIKKLFHLANKFEKFKLCEGVLPQIAEFFPSMEVKTQELFIRELFYLNGYYKVEDLVRSVLFQIAEFFPRMEVKPQELFIERLFDPANKFEFYESILPQIVKLFPDMADKTQELFIERLFDLANKFEFYESILPQIVKLFPDMADKNQELFIKKFFDLSSDSEELCKSVLPQITKLFPDMADKTQKLFIESFFGQLGPHGEDPFDILPTILKQPIEYIRYALLSLVRKASKNSSLEKLALIINESFSESQRKDYILDPIFSLLKGAEISYEEYKILIRPFLNKSLKAPVGSTSVIKAFMQKITFYPDITEERLSKLCESLEKAIKKDVIIQTAVKASILCKDLILHSDAFYQIDLDELIPRIGEIGGYVSKDSMEIFRVNDHSIESLVSIIVHESMHRLLILIFDNNSNPYYKFNTEAVAELKVIIDELKSGVALSHTLFLGYPEEEFALEILAHYYGEKAMQLLSEGSEEDKYSFTRSIKLTTWIEKYAIPAFKEFDKYFNIIFQDWLTEEDFLKMIEDLKTVTTLPTAESITTIDGDASESLASIVVGGGDTLFDLIPFGE
jgi:hypothetical protein